MKLLTHYIKKPESKEAEIINWNQSYINESLLYSYRDTAYSRKTYPSNMHYHDYYELIVIEEGDISYVCESSLYFPGCFDVIIIPPRNLHMSRINCDATRYKRHVFYLYPDAFDAIQKTVLVAFLKESPDGALLKITSPDARDECERLLDKLKKASKKNATELESALSFGLIIELFSLFNQKELREKNTLQPLPKSILEIKDYLDTHFTELSTVSEVAEHFFYSREYVSRLFKKHFDTTILDYIHKRRISESQSLIASGASVIDACYRVGFGSLSSFIRVFKEITGMKPSEYRGMIQNNG